MTEQLSPNGIPNLAQIEFTGKGTTMAMPGTPRRMNSISWVIQLRLISGTETRWEESRDPIDANRDTRTGIHFAGRLS